MPARTPSTAPKTPPNPPTADASAGFWTMRSAIRTQSSTKHGRPEPASVSGRCGPLIGPDRPQTQRSGGLGCRIPIDQDANRADDVVGGHRAGEADDVPAQRNQLVGPRTIAVER